MQQTLDVSNAVAAELAGVSDGVLDALRERLQCTVRLRGNQLTLEGDDRHVENARAVARMLAEHKHVEKVYYPGLETHPQHALCQKQMKAPGAMISFVVRGGVDKATRVLKGTRVFACAESLGGVESLIEHPGRMTHASVAGTDLEVPPDLIRLSVGIETADDLLADLDRSLG